MTPGMIGVVFASAVSLHQNYLCLRRVNPKQLERGIWGFRCATAAAGLISLGGALAFYDVDIVFGAYLSAAVIAFSALIYAENIIRAKARRIYHRQHIAQYLEIQRRIQWHHDEILFDLGSRYRGPEDDPRFIESLRKEI